MLLGAMKVVQLPPDTPRSVCVALAIAADPQTLESGIADLFNSARTIFAKVTMPTL